MLASAPDRPATSHHGSVDLTLAHRDGRTRIAGCSTRPPLMVQRSLYPDQTLPNLALVMLANPTGGLFQGDRHRVAINVGAGAAAHITTQGSTRIHAMPGGLARQDVELTVDDGGYLEYMPDPVIPFQGSEYEQRTSVSVAPGGALLWWEVLTPGRVAMGESFRYRRVSNRLEVLDGKGRMAYRESFDLTPATPGLFSRGAFGIGWSMEETATLGSMLLISRLADPEGLVVELQEALHCGPGASGGATRLPNGAGLGIKVIGPDAHSVRARLLRCWSVARRRLLGVDTTFLRKY